MPGDVEDEKPYEVDQDNWNAVMIFVAMCSQWRTSMAGLTGLDYNALPIVTQMGGYQCSPDDFASIRILEAAAMKELRARE